MNLMDAIVDGFAQTQYQIEQRERITKKYIDDRGWKYQVMSGIGDGAFKARYQKPDHTGSNGWKGLSAVKWRPTFEEAQADLDCLAAKRGWKEWNG